VQGIADIQREGSGAKGRGRTDAHPRSASGNLATEAEIEELMTELPHGNPLQSVT
jgi:hypothetical protein